MKILLTGATGFVGSEILRQLFADGHSVRVLIRSESGGAKFQGRPDVETFIGNILHGPSLAGCMEGIDAVMHLVGVIAEVGENTFDRVHRVGTENLLKETKKAKVKRFIHMSALGTRANARSQYHRSKWAGEEAVRVSGLDWTIFRPSIIYGRGDGFVNFFARMTRPPMNWLQLFTMPVMLGGHAHLQPIPVADVARCFAGAVSKSESIGKTYDLCGPSPLRLREIVRTICEVQGHEVKEIQPPFKRWIGDWSHFLIPIAAFQSLLIQPKVVLVPVPFEFATVIAWLMETFLSKPLLNRDQLIMLEEDNVGDLAAAKADFGISPSEFQQGLSAMLS